MNSKYLSEFLGTFLLTSCVVGSGIMAENLSNGIPALALLANTVATGAILFVIIKIFSQISGAHFNPVISLIFFLRRELGKNDFVYYVAFQIIAAIIAVIITHYLFVLHLLQISKNQRGELNMLVSEGIAPSSFLFFLLGQLLGALLSLLIYKSLNRS